MSPPDVMVLGDSFTEQNLWQSVLSEKTGLVVKSFSFEGDCILDWIAAAKQTDSKIIMIETVERNFLKKFSTLTTCSQHPLLPIYIPAGLKETNRPIWPPSLNFFLLTHTALNTFRLLVQNEHTLKSNNVVNTPILNTCAKFSHRRNDRLLYFADDDLKQNWHEQEIQAAIKNVLQIQKDISMGGKKFILILAPDKSTVYSSCFLGKNEPQKSISEYLISAGVNTPDLTNLFKQDINNIIDLYDPDNTHWSHAGYLLAGNEIGQYVNSLVTRSAKHLN
ncbi:hypothetical protein [Methylomonas sp. AM2-LC]|uniref:alginate O-acetyltransferase AlgX-related protein n=1 Tax=Methylomonas sp. AM2-LC TaxID=3153301 RepID=UPI003266920C